MHQQQCIQMHTGAKQDCCERTAPHPFERGWSGAAAGGGADVGQLSSDERLADDSTTVVARSFEGDQREVALTVGSSLQMSAGPTTPPPL